MHVCSQDVQAPSDSAWNADLARQLPALAVCALRHVAEAASRHTAASQALTADGALARAYALVPTSAFTRAAGGGGNGRRGALMLNFAGMDIDYSLLERAICAEPIVPVLWCEPPPRRAGAPPAPAPPAPPTPRVPSISAEPASARTLRFVRAIDAVAIPTPFLRWLPPPLLSAWLGPRAHPLALPLLGAAGESELWVGLPRPLDANGAAHALGSALAAEARRVADTNGSNSDAEAAALAVRLLAAYQEVHEDFRRKAKELEGTPGADGADAPPPPPPLLLATDRTLQPATALRWPSTELNALPQALQAAVLDSCARDGGMRLLHPSVATLLAANSGALHSARTIRKASALIDAARASAPPAQHVSMPALIRRFLSSSPDPALAVACARYLLRAGKPELLTHALAAPAAEGAPPILAPVHELSLGGAYGNADLERLQRGRAAFVSGVYVESKDERDGLGYASAERWRRFFAAAGAAEGLAFVVSVHPLPPSALPAGSSVRKNAKNVAAPYGLGTIDHKRPIELRVDLAPSAERLLSIACGSADGDEGRAFARLVASLHVDDASPPTPTACPALAPAVRGEAADSDVADPAADARKRQQPRKGQRPAQHRASAPHATIASQVRHATWCRASLSVPQ